MLHESIMRVIREAVPAARMSHQSEYIAGTGRDGGVMGTRHTVTVFGRDLTWVERRDGTVVAVMSYDEGIRTLARLRDWLECRAVVVGGVAVERYTDGTYRAALVGTGGTNGARWCRDESIAGLCHAVYWAADAVAAAALADHIQGA